jgi:NAD+ kinase
LLLARGLEVELVEDARGHCAALEAGTASLPKPDLCVVLGGDGTVLSTARAFAQQPVPILGINFGRVGYLAPVQAHQWQAGIDDVLDGRATLEPRMRLSLRMPDGAQALALNDVVFSRQTAGSMVGLQLEADGVRVSEYHADGLIFATPSGSTAYSLGAGGPILAPSMQAMVVTPISAHALAHRPLVLRPDAILSLRVLTAREPVAVSVDGQAVQALEAGRVARIERHPETYPLLAPAGLDPWRRLRDRLGWRASLAEEE